MQAIIPAAGYGTRLYPLTKNKPKALIEVAGKPLIFFCLKKLQEINSVFPGFLKKAVIVSNDFFFNPINEWLEENKNNFEFKVILLNDGTKNNEERLGTIGDVVFALNKEKIDDDIIIINSDNIFDFSLKKLIEKFNLNKKSCIALYDVKSLERAKKYGIVSMNNESKITEFKEKPLNPDSTLASIGLYVYPKTLLPKIKEFYSLFGSKADKSGNLLEWLIKKQDVFGVKFDSKWFDIGTLKELEEARDKFKNYFKD